MPMSEGGFFFLSFESLILRGVGVGWDAKPDPRYIGTCVSQRVVSGVGVGGRVYVRGWLDVFAMSRYVVFM
jgi:hypothetical protein